MAATQQEPPARSKPQELYGKLHLGMDHVLAKLLLHAPPLPAALKLQTETQSLATTWVHVSEAYEKRRAMLQRRKEKARAKAKAKSRDKKAKQREEPARKKEKTKEKKEKEEEKTTDKKKKSKSSSTGASPRSGRSSPSAKAEKKSQKKKVAKTTTSSPRVVKQESDVKTEEQPDAYQASVLKKLRRQPMCEGVAFGSNKYKAIVKWMELDQGKDAGTSPELMQLLTRLQLDAKADKKSKSKLTRKRSLETLDDALRAENRGKRKAASSDRRRSQKQRKAYVDEDEVVYESGEEEEEPEYKGSYSDSDEAEFMPELENSPPPEKTKKRAAGRSPKRQRKQVAEEKKEAKEEKEVMEESAGKTGMTSMEQLAAVVAKIRADDEASGKADTKYLSYEEEKKQKTPEKTKPGATSTSAIVLDDSDEEEEDEEEEDEEEEETKGADSSTDDDQDMFDLNEEDVYVVEAILCVKEGRSLLTAGGQRAKDADLYLVKWESYDELTWEPDENIPRRLIEMFRARERAKRACQYQIKVAHERREVTNVTTAAKEIIYLIQWINQENPVWESRTTLPIKTQVWLDKVLGVKAPAKKRRDTKVAKQYIYQ